MKSNEKEMLATLGKQRSTEPVQLLVKILSARLERYKDTLVSRQCEQTRGKAQEVKELLKALDIE